MLNQHDINLYIHDITILLIAFIIKIVSISMIVTITIATYLPTNIVETGDYFSSCPHPHPAEVVLLDSSQLLSWTSGTMQVCDDDDYDREW